MEAVPIVVNDGQIVKVDMIGQQVEDHMVKTGMKDHILDKDTILQTDLPLDRVTQNNSDLHQGNQLNPILSKLQVDKVMEKNTDVHQTDILMTDRRHDKAIQRNVLDQDRNFQMINLGLDRDIQMTEEDLNILKKDHFHVRVLQMIQDMIRDKTMEADHMTVLMNMIAIMIIDTMTIDRILIIMINVLDKIIQMIDPGPGKEVLMI